MKVVDNLMVLCHHMCIVCGVGSWNWSWGNTRDCWAQCYRSCSSCWTSRESCSRTESAVFTQKPVGKEANGGGRKKEGAANVFEATHV